MNEYFIKISSSGQTIFDSVISGDDGLYIPDEILEELLSEGLIGLDLTDLPLRTRSKLVKEEICKALGYPVPKSFKKVQPRFRSQNFDVYIQKSLNVQIWNEGIDPFRRYVLIRENADHKVSEIRVITGDELAQLDRTGTLTTKYQATMRDFGKSILFSHQDTKRVANWCNENVNMGVLRPNYCPLKNEVMPIYQLFDKLRQLEGAEIPHLGYLQERNRGAELHRLICKTLGFSSYEDDGTYPDILNQLLEIKLQTSPTIDLGLHSPSDKNEILNVHGQSFRSKDVRYVIVDGELMNTSILIRYIHVVNGKNFEDAFPLFGGKVKNAKLQIPLPTNFFKE